MLLELHVRFLKAVLLVSQTALSFYGGKLPQINLQVLHLKSP